MIFFYEKKKTLILSGDRCVLLLESSFFKVLFYQFCQSCFVSYVMRQFAAYCRLSPGNAGRLRVIAEKPRL